MSMRKTAFFLACGGMIFSQVSFGLAPKPYYPHGFYVEGGGSFNYIDVSSMDALPNNTTAVLKKSSNGDQGAGVFGDVGFAFANLPLRLEIAYIHRPKYHFNVSPVMTNVTPTYTLKSTLEDNALMLNGMFDLQLGSQYFVPFIKAGAGYYQNKSTAKATELVTSNASVYNSTKKQKGFTWLVGLGVHIKIFNNLFMNITAEHADIGKAKWGPWDAGYGITSKSVSSEEAMLSLAYFFGDQTPQYPPTLINE